jgi:hypothetical protein
MSVIPVSGLSGAFARLYLHFPEVLEKGRAPGVRSAPYMRA